MKSALILKAMSMHFPHNIRIRLAQLKTTFFLHPNLAPLDLLFFNDFLWQVSVESS